MGDSLRGFIYRVARPTQVLKPVTRRYMMIPHLIICTAMTYGAAFDRQSFTSPIFEPVFEIAPVEFWGAVYAVLGLVSFHAFLTAGWKAYVTTNLVTLGLSLMWATSMSYVRFWEGVEISFLAFGLWGFVIGTCFVLAIIPTRVTRTR